MLPDDNLWRRIEAFELDEPEASFTFTQRLARENGWALEYARAVVSEYKKFLYLARVAGHPVSPSDAVDEAWHLHLTYTRSYWEDLCGTVLERPFHHNPTQGGRAEAAKFHDWYGRTLQSYHRIFGEYPPRDIWPTVGERSTHRPLMKVDAANHWVIKKPEWVKLRRGVNFAVSRWKLALTAALLILFGAGCATQNSLGPFDWEGPEFLLLYWSLCGICIPSLLWWRNQNLHPDDEQFPRSESEHDPYLVSRMLSSDANRLAQIALIRLVQQKYVEVTPQGPAEVAGNTHEPVHPMECAVLNEVRAGRGGGNDLSAAVRLADARLGRKAQDMGLVVSGEAYTPLALQLCCGFVLLLLPGLAKLFIGLERDRPVGFLVGTMLLILVMGGVALLHPKARWTGRGRRYLDYLRRTYPVYHVDFNDGEYLVPMTVAMYGAAVMPPTMRPVFAPPPPQPTSGNNGSSCGGSSCGGTSGCGISNGSNTGCGSTDSGTSGDSGSSCGGGDSGGSSCGGCGGGGD